MLDLIVMRVAGNQLGPIGGEHVSRALMQLTSLTMLDLECMCLLCFWTGAWFVFRGRKVLSVCFEML